VSAERIGLLLTSLAGVSFGVSTLVFAPVVRRLGVALTCSLGLFLVAIGAPHLQAARRLPEYGGPMRPVAVVVVELTPGLSTVPSVSPGLGMLGLMPTLPLVWVAAMVYVVVRSPSQTTRVPLKTLGHGHVLTGI